MMKKVTTKSDLAREGTILVQLRLRSKKGDTLNSYDAYEMLSAALAKHPELEVYQAEFRVAKDEEKTSIE